MTAAVLLAGCAAQGVRQVPVADVSVGCVRSLGEISPMLLTPPLKPDNKVPQVQFASVARCYTPESGVPTPVALYRLNGVAAPARIDIGVVLSTGGTLPATVDLLDEGFRSVKHFGFESFVRRGSQYSLSAFLNPSMPTARYVLIAPDRTQAGKQDVAIGSASTPVPIVAGPVLFTYHAGSETNAVRPFVEGGLLSVTVSPQQEGTLTGASAP